MARDSGGGRLPWFRMWPRDFMADPVVQGLSWEDRGRYLWALLCSWETETPGVAGVERWACWLGVPLDETWRFSGLFEVDGGVWTQKRLRSEYETSRSESDRRSEASRKANSVRWNSVRTQKGFQTDSGRTPHRGPDGLRTESQAEAEAEAEATSKSESISPDGSENGSHRTVSRPPRETSYPEGFERFWVAYKNSRGRSVNKPNALSEWKRQRCESDSDSVLATLERYKLSREWSDGFMPYPAKWLKRRAWEDPAEPSTTQGPVWEDLA